MWHIKEQNEYLCDGKDFELGMKTDVQFLLGVIVFAMCNLAVSQVWETQFEQELWYDVANQIYKWIMWKSENKYCSPYDSFCHSRQNFILKSDDIFCCILNDPK